MINPDQIIIAFMAMALASMLFISFAISFAASTMMVSTAFSKPGKMPTRI